MKSKTEDKLSVDVDGLHPSQKHLLEAADSIYQNVGLSPYTEVVSAYDHVRKRRDTLNKEKAAVVKQLDDLKASPMTRIEYKIGDNVEAPKGSSIPDGEIVVKPAKDVFDIPNLDFDVPAFEWKSDHPLVPQKDELYQFNEKILQEILYCLIYDKRAFLTGHTGTGKSTHIEQVCARLSWPLIRANFDSELTRMEVVGKEALRVETNSKGESHTVTEFIETILPTAMRHGYIFLGDEWDSIRPDVAFVMQPVLEGKPLVLLEDESRVIPRHPMFRIFATGNTRGQGDDTGIYNGTRPQNAASMDRFEMWINFEYGTREEIDYFMKSHHPDIPEGLRERLAQFVREYWNGFDRNEISTPLSFRGVDNICSRTMFGVGSGTPAKEAVHSAILSTCMNKASPTDINVIQGVIQRCFKS